jgi:uncharacterized protein (UPF0335 family)
MSTVDNPERVKEYFRRREDMDNRKAEIAEELKEMKAEYKGENFDVSALEKAYKIFRADPDELAEEDFVIRAYVEAAKK